MFTVIIEFVNGVREIVFGLNRCESESLYEKYTSNKDVSYVSIVDERF